MFVCDTCGEIDHILIDGGHVGDRLLEGVLFEVRHEDGVFTAKPVAAAASYMKGLNEAKWNADVAEFAATEDTAECPKCGGDVDALPL